MGISPESLRYSRQIHDLINNPVIRAGHREESMPQYADTYFTSTDGLRLFARDYPGPDSNAATLLCLPGLTLHSTDYGALAAHLEQRSRLH
jgi:hypothetical protein